MMKKCFQVTFAVILGGLLFPSRSMAQQNELSVMRIMDDAESQIAKIEKNNYKISKLEIDLVFKSGPKKTLVKLVGGKTYEILAIGERNRVADLDLKIYDKDDNLIKSYPNTTNQIEAQFTPEESALYRFEFIASEFFTDYTAARYLLIVSFR